MTIDLYVPLISDFLRFFTSEYTLISTKNIKKMIRNEAAQGQGKEANILNKNNRSGKKKFAAKLRPNESGFVPRAPNKSHPIFFFVFCRSKTDTNKRHE